MVTRKAATAIVPNITIMLIKPTEFPNNKSSHSFIDTPKY
jgi:hypothetical protein